MLTVSMSAQFACILSFCKDQYITINAANFPKLLRVTTYTFTDTNISILVGYNVQGHYFWQLWSVTYCRYSAACVGSWLHTYRE